MGSGQTGKGRNGYAVDPDSVRSPWIACRQPRPGRAPQAVWCRPYPQRCRHTTAHPPVLSESDESIEVIELPRNAIPRIPRKKWRELIQKLWEVDPFICPQCAHLMRINGLLEDRDAAAALLDTLDWLGYATGSVTKSPVSLFTMVNATRQR
jgi:hypothetical protein